MIKYGARQSFRIYSRRESTMVRYLIASALVFLISITVISCSGHSNPVIPDNPELSTQSGNVPGGNHILWGYYQVSIDSDKMEAEITHLRTAELNVNVTQFLQKPFSPINLISIQILPESTPNDGFFAVDVTLQHPFPGVEQYRGFDVRGIFMSNGTSNLPGSPEMTYPGPADSHLLNEDGFTVWWNSTDFTAPGPFGFTPGALAPPVVPDAILNPYKYFCDDLEANSPMSNVSFESRGTFSATKGTNTRRYEIQFKKDGLQTVFDFNYAVDASWEDLGPDAPSYEINDFPISANQFEPWSMELSVADNTLFFIDTDTKGGSLTLDATIRDWQAYLTSTSVSEHLTAVNLYSDLLPSKVANIESLGATVKFEEPGEITYEVVLSAGELELLTAGMFEMWLEAQPLDLIVYHHPGTPEVPYSDLPLASYMRDSVIVIGDPGQLAPEVDSVDPEVGEQDELINTLKINGENFIGAGLQVEFSNGVDNLNLSNVQFISTTEIHCDLDLTGAAIDLYDVTVRVDNLFGPGTLEGTLPDGFAVISPDNGWPIVGKTTNRSYQSTVTGPQSSSTQVYNVASVFATAPETLLVGPDPDDPSDSLVYIGFFDSTAENFSAYHASDGSVKWSVSPSNGDRFYRLIGVAGPGVPGADGEDGTVYVAGYNPAGETIYALSAIDGSELWSYTPSPGSFLQLERYANVLQNGDIIESHANGAYCIDHTDGSEKWFLNYSFVQVPAVAISLDGNTMYSDTSTTVVAFDLTNDPPTFKWSISPGLTNAQQSSPIVGSDGYIYIASRTGSLKKISDNGTSASVEWATPSYGSSMAWTQLAEGANGSIYMIVDVLSSLTGNLYQIDMSDGSALHSSGTVDGLSYNQGMAIGSDGLIYSGARGYIYCFNPDCSINWSVSVPGSRFTDAALNHDGSLFVADTTNGRLYRYQE